MNFYNDSDPEKCRWLEKLIAAQAIPPGVVSSTPIQDLRPSDLVGFTQCHFFAGIAGWSLALELANWPAYVPVWTGSCPCQPFSITGKKQTSLDARDLWIHFYDLISQCRPPIILGEQVASPDGRQWFSRVRADLEDHSYAVGCADLCSASVGAPHKRQRLHWVADTYGTRPQGHPWNETESLQLGLFNSIAAGHFGPPGGRDFWSNFGVLPYRSAKVRFEPSTLPLAHGIPARVGRLHGYGDAINPVLAAHFIHSYLLARSEAILAPHSAL